MPTTWILPLLIGVIAIIAAVACAVMAPRLPNVNRNVAATILLALALLCVFGFAAVMGLGDHHIVWRIGYPVLFVACLITIGRLVLTKTDALKALFAVLGAMAGYVVGFLGSQAVLFAVIGLNRDAAMAVSISFGIPAGGAVFSLLGFWYGCKLDSRSRHTDSPRKWKAVFASLGAAVGPLIGFYTLYHYVFPLDDPDNHWGELVALAAGVFCGVPIGGILFCLLGFYIGCLLDGRSRQNGNHR